MTKETMKNTFGVTGLNHRGERALRAVVYEALQQFPKQAVSPNDMKSLLPEYDESAIRSAMRGLMKNPSDYPHVSRLARGEYIYDPTRSESWVTFPKHNKHKKKAASKAKPTPASPVQEAIQAKAQAAAQAERVLDETLAFVNQFPVFDQQRGCVSMDDERMLVDSQGRFWHATRV